MSNDKRKAIKINTPTGIAVYPWLNTPDTKFKAEGEYRVKLVLGAEESAAIREAAIKERDAFYADTQKALVADGKGAKAKALKQADLPFVAVVDETTGEETGKFSFNFKMKASVTDKKTGTVENLRPAIFDASGKSTSVAIYGGSKLKVAASIYGWDSPLLGVGVSLRLRGVQIIELSGGNGGGSAESMGFSKEDGFEAEETAKPVTVVGCDEDF